MSGSPSAVPRKSYRETLLGHLALRFATHPENLATEALAHLLRRSRAARQRMAGIARDTGAEIEADDSLTYDTQLNAGEHGIPDLVAYRNDSSVALLVEVKFGAPFTRNQPARYLDALPSSRSSGLLFLVPSVRVRHVWIRCQGHVQEQGLDFEVAEPAHPIAYRAFVGQHSVGVMSWRDLMSELDRVLREDDNPQPLADLQQLWGLVHHMEERMFVPFTGDDLNPERGSKYFQLVRLVDKLAERLAHEFKIPRGQVGTKGRLGSYGRTLQRYGLDWYLVVSPRLWARSAGGGAETPLWLALSEPGSRSSARIRRALAGLENQNPPRLFEYSSREVVLPLFIRKDQEEEGVLDDLVEQVHSLTVGLEQSHDPR